MMAFGASGATPKNRMAQISAGLGILKGIVVDQHFEQRTRLGRLLAVVAQSPSLVGIGLDEDTAAIIHADQTLEVIGRGAVTIVDGSELITDAFQAKAHRPIMVSGAILHSLPAGHRFDLVSRMLIPADGRVSDREARGAETARKRLRRLSREIATEGADSFVVDRKRGKAKEQLPEASE
jgi:cyanophycinase